MLLDSEVRNSTLGDPPSLNAKATGKLPSVTCFNEMSSIFPSYVEDGVIVNATDPLAFATAVRLKELVNVVAVPDSTKLTDPREIATAPAVRPDILTLTSYVAPFVTLTFCERVDADPAVCSALPALHDHDDPESVHDEMSLANELLVSSSDPIVADALAAVGPTKVCLAPVASCVTVPVLLTVMP